MDIINCFLANLTLDTRNAIWYAFSFLAFGVMAFASAIYESKRKNTRNSTIKSAIIAFLGLCVPTLVAYGIRYLTNHFIFPSGVIYCIPVIFLSSYWMHKELSREWVEAADQITASFLIARVVHITGCSFVGCCQGAPVSWGIYSGVREITVVPVQAIESVLILILWIIVNRYYQRQGFRTGGKVAAVGMFFFGLINLATDIFTVTFKKVFFMSSLEGVAAFVNMCAGLIMFYIVDKKKSSQTNSNIPATAVIDKTTYFKTKGNDTNEHV